MPFASAERPSIQIGLLTAIAERAGFETDAHHFNLDLAAELSVPLYEELCKHRGRMSGDWLFAPAAFGSDVPADEHSYLEEFPEELLWLEELDKDERFLSSLRHQVLPEFVDRCLTAVDWSEYGVIGFTSTFQQNTASIALAQRIKEKHPAARIVFGGANLEGDMGREMARSISCLDYVVSGEGDLVFPALLRHLADHGDLSAPMAGVISRRRHDLYDGGQASPVTDLDALPVPNYSGYFDRADALALSEQFHTRWTLPFESARGCWWGQKHHCTFCGLNGLGMTFRPKTQARVLDELAELSARHQISAFTAVDNILDWRYIPGLFTQLSETRQDYLFFYEVKANLTREQIQTMYRGGVRRVQPGIESMSSALLAAMRKGATMLHNVRCLKWCAYYGIGVDWNLLWGFPGETERDYEREREVLESITHFDPPIGCSRIWLERFSPYFTDPSFPVRNIRPEASYRYVYPERVNIRDLAYFFDYDMDGTIDHDVHQRTDRIVEQWQHDWASGRRHTLSYRRTRDCLMIDYTRGDKQGTYTLSEAPALMYEYCSDTMRSVDDVAAYLRACDAGYDYDEDDVSDSLDDFCRARLMVGDAGRYLSLALPSNPNW